MESNYENCGALVHSHKQNPSIETQCELGYKRFSGLMAV